MIDIIHRVGIKAPISKVYAALSTIEGVAGWWTNIKHKSIVYWSEGYFLLQVNSLEEALAIARQYPGLPYGAKMKVRPVAGECPLVEVRVLRKESINLANSKQTTVNKRLVPQSRDQPKKGKT